MNFIRGTVENGKICLISDLIVTRCLASRLDRGSSIRKILTFLMSARPTAFRPEAIKLAAPKKTGKEEGGYELVSNVDLTELLGDMTNVHSYLLIKLFADVPSLAVPNI